MTDSPKTLRLVQKLRQALGYMMSLTDPNDLAQDEDKARQVNEALGEADEYIMIHTKHATRTD